MSVGRHLCLYTQISLLYTGSPENAQEPFKAAASLEPFSRIWFLVQSSKSHWRFAATRSCLWRRFHCENSGVFCTFLLKCTTLISPQQKLVWGFLWCRTVDYIEHLDLILARPHIQVLSQWQQQHAARIKADYPTWLHCCYTFLSCCENNSLLWSSYLSVWHPCSWTRWHYLTADFTGSGNNRNCLWPRARAWRMM